MENPNIEKALCEIEAFAQGREDLIVRWEKEGRDGAAHPQHDLFKLEKRDLDHYREAICFLAAAQESLAEIQRNNEGGSPGR